MGRKYIVLIFASVLCSSYAWSWGGATHKFINKEAVKHLPPSLTFFTNNMQWISDHAVDADNRKNSDPTEAPKHFIDIEDYPEFAAGTLSHNIDTLIAKHGLSTVTNIGVVPWAIIWSLDSLTQAFQRGDSVRALQFAADLGHYVGDAHQPLHVTSNYDGQKTGNNGVHSRYETTMLATYLSQVTVVQKSVHFIPVPIDTNFAFIYHGNTLADSILKADTYAKSIDAQYKTAYYAALWQGTGAMTQNQIQDATVDLACLWYTAAVNAGMASITSVSDFSSDRPRYELLQNYPNPFNPSTMVSFTLGSATHVAVKVYDLVGREVETLVSGDRLAGTYRVEWKPNGVASGIYFCRMEASGFVQTQKLILMK